MSQVNKVNGGIQLSPLRKLIGVTKKMTINKKIRRPTSQRQFYRAQDRQMSLLTAIGSLQNKIFIFQLLPRCLDRCDSQSFILDFIQTERFSQGAG